MSNGRERLLSDAIGARTVIALDAVRRAARDLNIAGQADQREDLVTASLLIGELVIALGYARADQPSLERMLHDISTWTNTVANDDAPAVVE